MLSIKGRIEQANGPYYEAVDSAEIETEVLFSAVVAMDDTLPIEIYELIIGAIKDIGSSVQDF